MWVFTWENLKIIGLVCDWQIFVHIKDVHWYLILICFYFSSKSVVHIFISKVAFHLSLFVKFLFKQVANAFNKFSSLL